jgi:hypothetical protein
LHAFHGICLGFLIEIVHIVGPTKENRLVSQRRVNAPIPDRKLQPLKVQTLDLQRAKPTKGGPCTDLSVTKSSRAVVSGRILF